ncbi:hypothetical protein [Klebsiella pneumoniae]|uniref:hypothetical protein n=1 Tax=Klebsiella pneumoniae TaxID=573 RepID=UPI001FAB8CFB|nr:hypothetical protein [Klebsiella pneumoniae]MCI8021038.1 hypothetical protein [Klebsiella pneumoniae]
MALHLLTYSNVHDSCRRRTESCELWLRALIHDTLNKEFGENYVNDAKINGNDIFSQKLKTRIHSYRSRDPHRYKRPVDTLTFEDLSTIIGKEDAYREHFRTVFHEEFPGGIKHLKHTISIIANHRNALYHANASTLSLHDAERILCYCNDLITAIKVHYKTMNQNDKFPAPVFTKYSDSAGNVHYVNEPRTHLDFSDTILFMGDKLRFEVKVDSSYSPDEYDIIWRIKGKEVERGPEFILNLTAEHVGMKFGIQVDLCSKKEWHRIDSNLDALLTTQYQVLPGAHHA